MGFREFEERYAKPHHIFELFDLVGLDLLNIQVAFVGRDLQHADRTDPHRDLGSVALMGLIHLCVSTRAVFAVVSHSGFHNR